MPQDIIVPFILMPFKLKFFKSEYRNKTFNFLDVGCGNHSPSVTKNWFPNCEYYGIDKEDYINNEYDISLMTRYYNLDLTNDSLSIIPDNYFDIVVLSHIIEHLFNGLEIIEKLTKKIKQGGKIYIEFPSEHSLSLPSVEGSLNFCDDPTHVRVYSVREIANQLLINNFRVIRAGVRRDLIMMIIFPFKFLLKFIIRRKIGGGDFWDITGFASYVYAEKK